MNDEMWMRGWAENHTQFSADVDSGFAVLAGAISRLRRRRDARDVARVAAPGSPTKPLGNATGLPSAGMLHEPQGGDDT